MSRIPEITRREQLPESQRRHFDAIHEVRGGISPPFRYLLHAPELAARMAHLMSYIGFEVHEPAFPVDIKELAICTLARELDCIFPWASHEQRAIDAGVRREVIEAIRLRQSPAGLTAEEAAVVSYVQQLLRPPHRIADATFNALRARLGDAQLVEFTAILGAYCAVSCTLNAFNVPAAPWVSTLPV